MEIKTKFNIGDRVYILEILHRKWVVIPYSLNYDCVITEIAIRDDGIYYRNCLSIYSEKDCFLTKEEAQKECDRRNG